MSTHAMARSTTTYVLRDSVTMLRRNLLHWLRYPSLAIMLVAQPVVFLLLFVHVFGGTLGAGLPGVQGGGDRAEYLVFITPGILVMAVASVALGTAVEVALDMTGGIIARFRTMDIAQVSVLTGHVLGAVVKTLFAVAFALAFALLLGYRSDAGPGHWLIALVLLGLMAFAMTWLTVGMGLAADSVETASNTPILLVILPFLSSGFVPTDAMPWGLRHFAEHQPFTPMIDSLRALTGASACCRSRLGTAPATGRTTPVTSCSSSASAPWPRPVSRSHGSRSCSAPRLRSSARRSPRSTPGFARRCASCRNTAGESPGLPPVTHSPCRPRWSRTLRSCVPVESLKRWSTANATAGSWCPLAGRTRSPH